MLPSFMLGSAPGFEPLRVVYEGGLEEPKHLGAVQSPQEYWDPVRAQKELEAAGFTVEGPVMKMGRGWNAVVVVGIGSKKFRCIIDTGAARNLIRTSFAIDLALDPLCQKCAHGFFQGDRMIWIEGVHKEQTGGDATLVNVVCPVTLQFLTGGADGAKKTGPPIKVEFGCLASCADAMIIGMPTLSEWGMKVESDDQSHCYIEILKYGVRASVERERR
jgi:hypothetical protein